MEATSWDVGPWLKFDTTRTLSWNTAAVAEVLSAPASDGMEATDSTGSRGNGASAFRTTGSLPPPEAVQWLAVFPG